MESCAKQGLHSTLIYIEKLNHSQLVEESGNLIEREMLIDFVDILKSIFRSSDVITRIGDDKFLVLTSHNQSFEIERVLSQLKDKVLLANRKKQNSFHMQYSVGSFSFAPEYFQSAGRLIDLVDKRMGQGQFSEEWSLSQNHG